MPIQLYEEGRDKLLIVQVSGKLTKEDCAGFVPVFERLADLHGKLRVMFDMAGFHGWEASAAWEGVKSATRHFIDLERLAMLGEKKWQRGMATFCRSFTETKVRYFDYRRGNGWVKLDGLGRLRAG